MTEYSARYPDGCLARYPVEYLDQYPTHGTYIGW